MIPSYSKMIPQAEVPPRERESPLFGEEPAGVPYFCPEYWESLHSDRVVLGGICDWSDEVDGSLSHWSGGDREDVGVCIGDA
jgi:hypothetical protein